MTSIIRFMLPLGQVSSLFWIEQSLGVHDVSSSRVDRGQGRPLYLQTLSEPWKQPLSRKMSIMGIVALLTVALLGSPLAQANIGLNIAGTGTGLAELSHLAIGHRQHGEHDHQRHCCRVIGSTGCATAMAMLVAPASATTTATTRTRRPPTDANVLRAHVTEPPRRPPRRHGSAAEVA